MSETIDTVNTLEYPYTRTTGPFVGPFLTALRDGKLIANKIDGRTFCPPLEYDPLTGASALAEFVEVGPGGTVVGWTWIAEPSEKHPFPHPFAFALIKIDGTDVPMLHAVDAGTIDVMSTLMRVAAQYRDERHGAITDVYFVPEAKAQSQSITPTEGTVEITEHLISLKIREPMYPHRQRFAAGLLAGKIIGQKSPVSGKVYVPGRGYDNLERVPLTEADDVVVADRGTVVAFTVLTPVQYYGQKETEPYIRCSILLDNSDQPIIGVDVRDIPLDEFHVGMRLGAVWKKPGERSIAGLDNRGGAWEQVIDRWAPTGEPDVHFEAFKEHTW